jgi:heparan-alpha-glucosaminide N-acetyltransferase
LTASFVTMVDSPNVSARTSKISDVASTKVQRVIAIDVLRALTMILMIFVNDLWSLSGIPVWLEHVAPGVDGIGLSDVVFPAFLFIVGLSLPFAIDARRSKGDNDAELVKHVLWRSFALLVMGVFLVNGESINAVATGVSRLAWNTLCCFSFILIWNKYPEGMRVVRYILQGLAVMILGVLAVIYRGGEADNLVRFAPQWWGILGLIGWSYLVSGLITVFAHNKITIVLASWLFFTVLSMLFHAGLVPSFLLFIPEPILGGTLTGLTIGGVLTALIFKELKDQHFKLTWVLLGISLLLVGMSVVTRPYWGLAKLGATPAWLFLCSAFTIQAFVAIYWIADVFRKEKWFAIIKPAGTATLLCYLIPYFAYATTALLGVHLPDFMLVGGVGLFKSFLFALLCAGITGLLLKAGLKFRI